MRSKPSGFSLLELLLALGLTALVTVLLGQLMQTYVAQSSGPVDQIVQAQEARKILTMISDDLRGVVRAQSFDQAALQQIISGALVGGQRQGGQNAQATGGQGGGQAMPTSTGNASMDTGSGANASGTLSGDYPPGIYGTSTNLELDISRIPRPDQYFVQQSGPITSTLTDIPSDTKTVSYFVQAPTNMGVTDPLESSAAGSGGLVRRQIDRSIYKWANSQGQVEQLNRTGEIISPAVVSIEFAYFNGSTWSYSWDSSVEGLPWSIEVIIAMQDPVVAKEKPMSPGTDISTMDTQSLSDYGIHTYKTTVVIPGANLLSVPQASQATGGDNGMGSVGL